MKFRISVIGLSVIMSLSLMSQPFISADKQWNVRLINFGLSTEVFKIEGDTTLNTLNYNKIWVSYDSLVSWIFMGLLRENENVVYYVSPNSTEGILYNFNLQVGDSAHIRNYFCNDTEVPVYVADIDTVEHFGVSRKRWHIENNGYVSDYWLTGIGSLSGPLYSYYSYCIICPTWELLCYHEGENLLYITPGENECYQSSLGIEAFYGNNEMVIIPNPVKRGSDITVELKTKPRSICVFNLTGVLVQNNAQINGKTVMIETTNLNRGYYFLKISTEEGKVLNNKFLIE